MTYSKEEVLDKTKAFAKMLSETKEVELFKNVEKQLNENKKFSELMKERKLLQKEAVNLEQLDKPEALAEVRKRIEEIQNVLDAMPIVQEFMESQNEVNELLQTVTSVISSKLNEEIC